MRERLEKFLGMLGSDFDGERANAAAFIAKMARERKQTIVELMQSAFGGSASKPQSGNSSWGSAWRNTNPPPRPEPEPDWEDIFRKRDKDSAFWKARQRQSRRTRGHDSGDIRSQLSDVINHKCLTDWEHLFIVSVTNQWNSEFDLSPSQRTVAEKILHKCKYHDEHQTAAGWWPGDES